MRIVVTGGSGKAGRWVVRDLRDHGHDVRNLDAVDDGARHGGTLITDLGDLGQALDGTSGVDAVVHLAAVPGARKRPRGETFRLNTLSTYNVFAAAEAHRVRRVVWASSDTVLGIPYDEPPSFVPVDEAVEPQPGSTYALSKLLGEVMGGQFARRTGIPFLALRLGNITAPEAYAAFPAAWADAMARRWNLWNYVDVRDVAQAVRRGLEADLTGADVCIVAAAETMMPRDSASLVAEGFPGVDIRRPLVGRESLLSSDRARRLIGYEPAHRWADHLADPGT